MTAKLDKSDPMVGQRIGEYEVLGRIARGGMAELFLAKRVGIEGFEKVVVLKRILPHLAEHRDFVEMFLAEARLAAKLEHPNIVHVSDIGRAGRDYFFTMAYLHGADLLEILRATAKGGARLPLQHALTVGIGMCAGLHYAHEQVDFDGTPLEIVHRDISPANVLVTYDGNIKIVDFGIAKAAAHTNLTRVGVRKGKASYMSPEQCKADPLDRRSDLWAIGVVLYEMTTMRRLFRAETDLAIMHKIVASEITPPSQVLPDYPPDLEAVVIRCLQKEPSQRFQTALEVRRALENFAYERRISTSTVALGEYLRDLLGRRAYPWAEGPGPEAATGPPPKTPSIGPPKSMPEAGPVPPLAVTAPGQRPAAPAPRPTPAPAPRGRTQVAESTPAPEASPAPVGWERSAITDYGAGAGAVTESATMVARIGVGERVAWAAAAVAAVAAAGGVGFTVARSAEAPVVEPPVVVAAQSDAETPPTPAQPEQVVGLVNQRDPSLSLPYARRQALLERLASSPEIAGVVDQPLQAALDLLQAEDAPDPCQTFRDAMGRLEPRAPDRVRPLLGGVTPPANCEGLELEWATARSALTRGRTRDE